MATTQSQSKLVVIVGETASGKSGLAMDLAKELNGEIISADSWTVYKGFDIGTAKASKEEQKQIKHYLLDVADPEDGFTAPIFKDLAERAIEEIKAKNKTPIVVGGTGLYIDSLLFDYGFLDRAAPDERKRLNSLSLEELLSEAKAKNIDLESIDTRNKRRIIRAIENNGLKPSKKSMRTDAIAVGIKLPRDQLKKRIEQRVDKMFKDGLEAEVKQLSEKYSWEVEPMKGIGYREFKKYFEGEINIEQLKQQIIASNVQLAKKQRTWFKRNKDINWFESVGEARDFVLSSVNN